MGEEVAPNSQDSCRPPSLKVLGCLDYATYNTHNHNKGGSACEHTGALFCLSLGMGTRACLHALRQAVLNNSDFLLCSFLQLSHRRVMISAAQAQIRYHVVRNAHNCRNVMHRLGRVGAERRPAHRSWIRCRTWRGDFPFANNKKTCPNLCSYFLFQSRIWTLKVWLSASNSSCSAAASSSKSVLEA